MSLNKGFWSGEMLLRDNLGQEFCFISEGSFLGGPDGHTEMKVVAPFYLGKIPVSSGLFHSFLADTGYDYSKEDLALLEQISPTPDCPVANVSWNDAKSFCRWLRKKTGEYYSLATEIEWEKAARGSEGFIYPWGVAAPTDEHCYFDKENLGKTIPSGQLPKGTSPFGCQDMAGNIWEWCLDSFDDERDPHILKGGSWKNTAEFLNCGKSCISYPPEKRKDYTGFRLLYLTPEMLVDYKTANMLG